jgi:hypothetical protein
MRCSFDGVIGAGSAPERSTSSSLRESSSCLVGSLDPIVIVAWPPEIFARMRGALSTLSSRMIANRFCTFSPVICSNRVAPDSVNDSATSQPPVDRWP